jgi:hypothetical protein
MAPSLNRLDNPVSKREQFVYDSFWWSPTGYIVKWAILAGIFLIFVVWFLGGYLHAQRRMKRGLPPMKYHAVSLSYS